MAQLLLVVLAVEKCMRAKRHGYHYIWSAGKLVRCVSMASAVGWLDWS